MPGTTIMSQFRKLDIDRLNDNFIPEENFSDDSSKTFDENLIKSLLHSGKNIEALNKILESAPLGIKNPSLREPIYKMMMMVLYSFKSVDISSAVNLIPKENLDSLMKYIYKGFEHPPENNSSLLLNWHEKVFALAGYGCIVRVLTDRRKFM